MAGRVDARRLVSWLVSFRLPGSEAIGAAAQIFVGDPSLRLAVEADSRPFRFLLIDLNLLPSLEAGDHFPSRLSAQIQLVRVDEMLGCRGLCRLWCW